MLRQASSRSQRGKGFRVKHALQICLLIAISIWLLYQLKHSFDKKRALEARNSKFFDKVVERHLDFFKLSRKDLLPRSGETGSMDETRDKGDENEEEEKETENEGGRGAGDDRIDETDDRDLERGEEVAENGEDRAVDEDKVVKAEGAFFLDGGVHDDHEGDSREAREENYKRDYASSAVRQDTQTAASELGNGNARGSDVEIMEEKGGEGENMANEAVDGSKVNDGMNVGTLDGFNGNASDVALGDNETTPKGDLSMNGTSVEEREQEVAISKLEVLSISDSITSVPDSELQSNSTESNNQMELQADSAENVFDNKMQTQNSSTEVDVVAHGVPLHNGTVGFDSVQDRNTTVDIGTPGDDKPNLVDAAMEQTEKSNTSDNGDAAQGKPADSLQNTMSAEGGEARDVLSTSPNIQNEARKDEDVAAE